MTQVVASELKSFIERIERLEEEKSNLAGDITSVFDELKSRGFDAKIVRQIIRMRKQEEAKRQEEEALLDAYMAALGME